MQFIIVFQLFAQWLGESDLRSKMQGRLVLVHLICRDKAPPQSSESLIDNGAAGKSHLYFRNIIKLSKDTVARHSMP